jgi:hypothetical protein
MIIEQEKQRKPAEYYVPKRPCRRCGSRQRYLSTRHCVACKRAYDLEREGDRRSKRAKALDRLERQHSMALREFPRAMQDAFIRAHYPNWRDNENNL